MAFGYFEVFTLSSGQSNKTNGSRLFQLKNDFDLSDAKRFKVRRLESEAITSNFFFYSSAFDDIR